MTFLEERKNPDSNTVMTAQEELIFLEAVVVLAVVVELRPIKGTWNSIKLPKEYVQQDGLYGFCSFDHLYK